MSERGEYSLEDDPTLIEHLIEKFFSGSYFLPLSYDRTNTYDNKVFLFRGYIFLEFCPEFKREYIKLTSSPYFTGPLLTSRKIHILPDIEIRKFKRQLARMVRPRVKVGDEVRILDGKYKNLEATIMEYYKKEKTVDLSVELKCMSIIVPKIPIMYLENISKVKKNTKNILQDKVTALIAENTQGLSRKEIILNINLNDKEIKRLSTCLSRAVKKGFLKSFLNNDKRLIFTLR